MSKVVKLQDNTYQEMREISKRLVPEYATLNHSRFYMRHSFDYMLKMVIKEAKVEEFLDSIGKIERGGSEMMEVVE